MTETHITDICAVKMEESRKFPVLCAEAQMCQVGLALSEERAALGKAAVGVQILYFQFAALILFRYREEAACKRSALSVRKD